MLSVAIFMLRQFDPENAYRKPPLILKIVPELFRKMAKNGEEKLYGNSEILMRLSQQYLDSRISKCIQRSK
jgi:hypothetical protein